MKAKTVLFLLLGPLLVISIACTNKDKPPHPAEADVLSSSCHVGPSGTVDGTVELMNHSGKRSDYTVSFTLLDKANINVGDALATANNVEPGQRAEASIIGTAQGNWTTCKLAQVLRIESIS